jgi:enoyl-CoA hydratase/carnithine racemase
MSDTAQESTAPVLYEVREGVAHVTLNRPEQLNALNGAAHYALLESLQKAAADDAVRAVVVSGNGRAFSAGGDVKAVAAGEDVGDPKSLGMTIWNMPKAVIAKVHGYCLGQAYELSAMCDLTIAGESAQFGEVEVQRGWGPPMVITPLVVGLKSAKQILMLGEVFDAGTALRMGLVNAVVPDDQLDDAVKTITDRLVSLKPEAVANSKRLVNGAYELATMQEVLAQPTQPVYSTD